MPFTSVIIPVFNEEHNIIPMYEELCRHLTGEYEIIWIDDGSTDSTGEILRKLSISDSKVKVLCFSRNFGHQHALMAGIINATGDYLITIDGDLQHPPALIPALIAALENGVDIAQTRRINTEGISIWKRMYSKLFYLFINSISDTPINANESDFRAFNKKVSDEIRKFSESDIFLRGIFNWIGFNKIVIPFHAPARKNGLSKYSFGKMLKLALRGTTSFSFKPLRISLFFGIVTSMLSFILLIFSLTAYFKGKTVPGWTSLMTALTFMGGMQMLVIGIMGEYIAALFREAKKRPCFIIKDKINF